jgi:hypothetical protein
VDDGRNWSLRGAPRSAATDATWTGFSLCPEFESQPAHQCFACKRTLTPDEGALTRFAIASCYLGPERGARYSDLARRPPGVVVRLPVAAVRAWDLVDKMP